MRGNDHETVSDAHSGRVRAQSETLGFILLFSIVILGAATVLVFGAVAVSDSQQSLSGDRAEKVMTQMDSEISMVALGRTNSQEMQFERSDREQFSVDGDAGTINITTVGSGPDTVIMPDTKLGAVVFERGETKIAYQGGGVWRSDGGPGSSMISPPEFNYRDQTLTLPLVTISGDKSLSGDAVIRKDGPSQSYFPNATKSLSNPLEDEIVQVTIESEYHLGWKTYFNERTEGDVTYTPSQNRVTVNLTAPAVEEFEHGAATTGPNPPQSKNNGEIIGSTRTNIQSASVSPNVEDQISNCPSGCTDIDGTLSGTKTAGTYFTDEELEVEDTVLDTSDGDIRVVVDDELSFSGSTELDITGDGRVKFYVNDTVDFSGTPDINTGGDPEQLLMLVHSSVDEVGNNGSPQFTGYIYAPNSNFNINGGGSVDENIVGGVVAEEIDVGNGVINHVPPDDLELRLGAPTNVLTFLHISTNPVTVTAD
ncbi:DUF7289 family protein [Halovenus halobia]|uniref:DUF7289 family protein n=1 Tax=Halovenus halobia TaxID=3396622 RepID=UPI003F56719C